MRLNKMTMFYFAYGSNLSTLRLQERVPSASLITTGQLWQHQLLFHKIGRDGSAKCDAFFTGHADDVLFGAVYRIDPNHKQYLDNAEGLGNGYELKQVTIHIEPDSTVNAFTYYATRTDESLKPFDWYKQHVLAGAQEHRFPKKYIDQIVQIRTIKDDDAGRIKKELSIYTTDRKYNNSL